MSTPIFSRNQAQAVLLSRWHHPARKIITRSLALILSLSFALPSVSFAFDVDTYQYANSTQLGGPGSRELASDYKVSAEYGKVIEADHQPGGLTCVLVQDLHCNAEIQNHIRGLLRQLADRHPDLRLVAVEGAQGILPSLELARIPDSPGKRAATGYFVREGKLSGADCLTICDRPDMELFGAEDSGLYERSLALVREFMTEENRGLVYEYQERLNADEARTLNPELAAFEQSRRDVQQGRLTGEAHHDQMLARAGTLKLDLLPPELKTLNRLRPLDLNELNLQDIYLEKQIRQALCRTDEETRFIAQRRFLESADRLLSVSGAPEDVTSMAELKTTLSFGRLQQRLDAPSVYPWLVTPEDAAQLDRALDQALQFYELAETRNRTLLGNAVQRARQRGENKLVLVAGGYHTRAMARLARAQGHAVVAICPRMDRPDAGSNYFQLLRNPGQPTELENILANTQTRRSAIAVVEALSQQPFVRQTFPRSVAWMNRALRNGTWVPNDGGYQQMVLTLPTMQAYYVGRVGNEVFVAETREALAAQAAVHQKNNWTDLAGRPAVRIIGWSLLSIALIPLAVQSLLGAVAWPVLAVAGVGLALLAVWRLSLLGMQRPGAAQAKRGVVVVSLLAGMVLINWMSGDLFSQTLQVWLGNLEGPWFTLKGWLEILKPVLNFLYEFTGIHLAVQNADAFAAKWNLAYHASGALLIGPMFSGLIKPVPNQFKNYQDYVPQEPKYLYGQSMNEIQSEALARELPKDMELKAVFNLLNSISEKTRRRLNVIYGVEGKETGAQEIFSEREQAWVKFAMAINGLAVSSNNVAWEQRTRTISMAEINQDTILDVPLSNLRITFIPDKENGAARIIHAIVVSHPKFVREDGSVAPANGDPLPDWYIERVLYALDLYGLSTKFVNLVKEGMQKAGERLDHYRTIITGYLRKVKGTVVPKTLEVFTAFKITMAFHEYAHKYALHLPDVAKDTEDYDKSFGYFMNEIIPGLETSFVYTRNVLNAMIIQGRRADPANAVQVATPDQLDVGIAEETFCDRFGMFLETNAMKLVACRDLLKLQAGDGRTIDTMYALEDAWLQNGVESLQSALEQPGGMMGFDEEIRANSGVIAHQLADIFRETSEDHFYTEVMNDPPISPQERAFYRRVLNYLKHFDIPGKLDRTDVDHFTRSRIIRNDSQLGLKTFVASEKHFGLMTYMTPALMNVETWMQFLDELVGRLGKPATVQSLDVLPVEEMNARVETMTQPSATAGQDEDIFSQLNEVTSESVDSEPSSEEIQEAAVLSGPAMEPGGREVDVFDLFDGIVATEDHRTPDDIAESRGQQMTVRNWGLLGGQLKVASEIQNDGTTLDTIGNGSVEGSTIRPAIPGRESPATLFGQTMINEPGKVIPAAGVAGFSGTQSYLMAGVAPGQASVMAGSMAGQMNLGQAGTRTGIPGGPGERGLNALAFQDASRRTSPAPGPPEQGDEGNGASRMVGTANLPGSQSAAAPVTEETQSRVTGQPDGQQQALQPQTLQPQTAAGPAAQNGQQTLSGQTTAQRQSLVEPTNAGSAAENREQTPASYEQVRGQTAENAQAGQDSRSNADVGRASQAEAGRGGFLNRAADALLQSGIGRLLDRGLRFVNADYSLAALLNRLAGLQRADAFNRAAMQASAGQQEGAERATGRTGIETGSQQAEAGMTSQGEPQSLLLARTRQGLASTILAFARNIAGYALDAILRMVNLPTLRTRASQWLASANPPSTVRSAGTATTSGQRTVRQATAPTAASAAGARAAQTQAGRPNQDYQDSPLPQDTGVVQDLTRLLALPAAAMGRLLAEQRARLLVTAALRKAAALPDQTTVTIFTDSGVLLEVLRNRITNLATSASPNVQALVNRIRTQSLVLNTATSLYDPPSGANAAHSLVALTNGGARTSGALQLTFMNSPAGTLSVAHPVIRREDAMAALRNNPDLMAALLDVHAVQVRRLVNPADADGYLVMTDRFAQNHRDVLGQRIQRIDRETIRYNRVAAVRTAVPMIPREEAERALQGNAPLLRSLKNLQAGQLRHLVRDSDANGYLVLTDQLAKEYHALLGHLIRRVNVEVILRNAMQAVPGVPVDRLPWSALQAAVNPAFEAGAEHVALDFDFTAYQQTQRLAERLKNAGIQDADIMLLNTSEVAAASMLPVEYDLNGIFLDEALSGLNRSNITGKVQEMVPGDGDVAYLERDDNARSAAIDAVLEAERRERQATGLPTEKMAASQKDQALLAKAVQQALAQDRATLMVSKDSALARPVETGALDWAEEDSMFANLSAVWFLQDSRKPLTEGLENRVVGLASPELTETAYIQTHGLKKIRSALVLLLAVGHLVGEAVNDVRGVGKQRKTSLLGTFLFHRDFRTALNRMLKVVWGGVAAREALPPMLQRQIADLDKLIASLAQENKDIEETTNELTPRSLRLGLAQLAEFKRNLLNRPLIGRLIRWLGFKNLISMYPELFVLLNEANNTQSILWEMAPANTLRLQAERLKMLDPQLRANLLRDRGSAQAELEKLGTQLDNLPVSVDPARRLELTRTVRDMKFTLRLSSALDKLEAEKNAATLRRVMAQLIRELGRKDVGYAYQLDILRLLGMIEPYQQVAVQVRLEDENAFMEVIPLTLPQTLIDSGLRDILLRILYLYKEDGQPMENYYKKIQRFDISA